MNTKRIFSSYWLCIVGYTGFFTPPSSFGNTDLIQLGKALTHHVSFDESLEADYTKGDAKLYSFTNAAERDRGGIEAVIGDTIEIVEGGGKYYGSLLIDQKSEKKWFYKSAGILGYSESDWSGTVSVWLRLSPDSDLPAEYCDPVRIMGDSFDKGFMFLEWSRDHNPRLFRYAILPRQELWNPTKATWDEIPNKKRPMVEVKRAPFSRAKWTHVAFTYVKLNTKREPSGALYIDGKLQGSIQDWDLRLGWAPDAVKLLIGVSYVGHMDDLAVFNRALSSDEIDTLYSLKGGVGSLSRTR